MLCTALAKTLRLAPGPYTDEEHTTAVAALYRAYPDFIKAAAESRRAREYYLEEAGAEPDTPGYNPDAGVISVPEEFQTPVSSYFAKLGLALFYKHIKRPAPGTSHLLIVWFTNKTVVDGGLPPQVSDMFPQGVELKRGNATVEGQFDYRWVNNDAEKLFGAFAVFGDAFGGICVIKESKPLSDLPWRPLGDFIPPE